MIIEISSKTINMIVRGGEILPTSSADSNKLYQTIKRSSIPLHCEDIYFARIVAAGYKLAIQNH